MRGRPVGDGPRCPAMPMEGTDRSRMRGSPWIRERLQVALAGIGVLLQALS